jgi:hypothetical protein
MRTGNYKWHGKYERVKRWRWLPFKLLGYRCLNHDIVFTDLIDWQTHLLTSHRLEDKV